MKLVEEKTLLRRKDNIKARLKDLAAYELAQQDVQALKVGHSIPLTLFTDELPPKHLEDRSIPYVSCASECVCLEYISSVLLAYLSLLVSVFGCTACWSWLCVQTMLRRS